MSSFTTSDGVRLDYVESGQPTGRAVVLVAGFKAPATSWLYQVDALVSRGYRVIAFDRRSHGTSEKPAHGHTMQRHGQDLGELLEALDVHDAALVGGSMGGNTIWSYVRQFGTARLAGIVIVDQTPKMLNGPDWPHGFYDYTESNRDTAFATGIPDPKRFSVWSKGPVRIRRILRALRSDAGPRSRTKAAPGFTEHERALLNDHARADWRDAIERTTIPVLFIAGAQSEFWPSSHAAASAGLAANGRAVVIPRDGHAANIEQPKAFNRELLTFLDELTPRA